ncbi:hypothetical protein IFM51744_02159 [Aspergillus udagawae]|nr:hypothetical protein IFM51744_02159 [Aspergillus udagawae]
MALEDGMEENEEVKELTITPGYAGDFILLDPASWESTRSHFKTTAIPRDSSQLRVWILDSTIPAVSGVWSPEFLWRNNGDSRRPAYGMPKRSEVVGTGGHTRGPFAFGMGK